jgi:hypothetical protein
MFGPTSRPQSGLLDESAASRQSPVTDNPVGDLAGGVSGRDEARCGLAVHSGEMSISPRDGPFHRGLMGKAGNGADTFVEFKPFTCAEHGFELGHIDR